MMYLVCKISITSMFQLASCFTFLGLFFMFVGLYNMVAEGGWPSANKIKVCFVILTIERKLLWIYLVPQFNPSDKYITALSLI